MSQTADRPFLGIMLMLAFCVLAPLGDSMAKLLGGAVSLSMLVFVRFAVQAIILVPLVWRNGTGFSLPKGTLHWTLLRTVLHIAGIGLMFSALRYLPLADTLAIAFVMPFIMLLLGHFVMDEEVGKHRMVACFIGFIGTLLVIQPNFVEVGFPALLPLGVAVVFALFMMVTRNIAQQIDAVKLQAVSGLQACALLLPVLAYTAPEITALDSGTIAMLLVLGVIGTLAHLFMTWSLRFAPASTLAPMQYLEIPFGTAIGWAIFADLPNGLATFGIFITMAAGLYVIIREGRLSVRATKAPPAA
ncbi:DMT family transporter [Yoonia sp. I 8.24]|uniref:DMT family transporter n=1 Tax=Yoonia sp. I 8.24 TaxID=1537229 RepID=UPI001EE03E42|nr:DMT family transporter [Yoonia sp. I 8.24]MCG3267219.1 DMT family transporter [Yoonia sp. I 8.24]